MSDTVLRAAPAIVPGGMLAFVPVAAGLHDPRVVLDPAELALAESVSPVRRDAFIAGRVALRAAVHAVQPGASPAPLLRTGRGAPALPHGLSGSISHKRARAVAIAAPHDDAHVGVDLEVRRTDAGGAPADAGRALARRILTPRERDAIASLDDVRHRDATLLAFALKEAVYKAIDPFVRRYVGFTEVEIEADGSAHLTRDEGAGTVALLLPEAAITPMSVQVAWWMEPAWIVAVAVARRA